MKKFLLISCFSLFLFMLSLLLLFALLFSDEEGGSFFFGGLNVSEEVLAHKPMVLSLPPIFVPGAELVKN